MKQTFILGLICLFTQFTFAQFSTGTWRDHLPYGQTVDVCTDENGLVYAATPYSMYEYNPFDGGITRYSKVNRLSDVGISAIEYYQPYQVIVVGYENGNLDLLFKESEMNVPDIKFSSYIGDKRIYDFHFKDNLVYLSTGIGVVVYDLDRLEFRGTYVIGENGSVLRVNDVAVYEGIIYASTDEGIKVADENNTFLANYQNWTDFTDVPAPGVISELEFFVGNLFLIIEGETKDIVYRKDLSTGTWSEFVNFDNLKLNNIWSNVEWMGIGGDGAFQVYHNDLYGTVNQVSFAGNFAVVNNAVMDIYGGAWGADANNGLFWKKYGGEEVVVRPQGPAQSSVRRISAYNNNVWIAHGAINDSWGNLWNKPAASGFVNDTWYQIPLGNGANETGGVNDLLCVAVDPIDNNHVVFGSWEEGIVDVNLNGTVRYFNPETNDNTLESADFDWAPGWTGVAGITYDLDGVMYCTNSFAQNNIHARTRDSQFYEFDFSPQLNDADRVADIIATQAGYIWAIIPGKGLLILNTNGTLNTQSDDNYKILTDTEGNGALANKEVFCVQEDLDGEVWVGTLQGLCVFYNQEAIFSEENFDSEKILIQQDGNNQYLLETETINAIEVDGGNRKWVATQNSGVYLFSDDGLRTIYHFTDKNSPLLSNNVYDIAINQQNGEVFFATQNGVVSFFSTATNFDQKMSEVKTYPNPVREEYEGNITIDGLAYDTNVKITDIQGNIVFETTSQGGRAVWDGKTLSGNRPATGVYLVFASNQDGTVDNVGKITIIR